MFAPGILGKSAHSYHQIGKPPVVLNNRQFGLAFEYVTTNQQLRACCGDDQASEQLFNFAQLNALSR